MDDPVKIEQTDYLEDINFQKIRKKLLYSLSVLLILFSGLSIGLILLQQPQDIRKKAATETVVDVVTQRKLVIYKSIQFGYQVTFDPNFWKTGANLEQDNQEISLSLKQDGPATVKITAFLLPTPSSGLDLLVTNVVNELGEDKAIKLANIEKIERNGREYYKLTFKEKFLNVETEYYQYITIQNQMYYVIETKYSLLEPVPTLTQNLIDSIKFSSSLDGESVQGVSNTVSQTGGLGASQIAELAKPSVVSIIHLYCTDITIDKQRAQFLQPKYNLCGLSKGTGFIIGESGYIATNGHVVKRYREDALATLFVDKSHQFATDLVREIASIQQNRDVSTIEAQSILTRASDDPIVFNPLLQLAYRLLEQKVISLGETKSRYLVNLGNELVKIDLGKVPNGELLIQPPISNAVREAELVDFDYPNKYSIDSVLKNEVPVGSDVAIIKVKNVDSLSFPTLRIESSSIAKEGETIVVIGYPTLVEGSTNPREPISYASSTNPSVSLGIVSSIKKDQRGSTLIQTDASIEHGNSGGPAFDQNGKVIGIATHSLSSGSGNYNFLRATEDLIALVSKHSIIINNSQTYTDWAKGLENLWSKQYKTALALFQKAQRLYPVSPIFQQYINKTQEAIQRGDGKNKFSDIFSIVSLPAALFLILAGLTSGVLITLLLFPSKFKVILRIQ